MQITKKDVKKLEDIIGYEVCRNCVNQISPLRMCEWAENGGDGHLHLRCPMWIKKEEK